MKFFYFLNIIFIYFQSVHCFYEEVSNLISYNTISLLSERCDDHWIKPHFKDLMSELDTNLYGQPLVRNLVVYGLMSHRNSKNRRKPLVMSFHGTPGVGKSYVGSFIAKHIFFKGVESNFVKKYHGKKDFPLESEVYSYQMRLHREIMETVSLCKHSLFIFDEVDKYPRGVLDAVKTYIDYNEYVDNIDFRNAVFIFLTNNGQELIVNKSLHLWKDGVQREEFKLKHFEKSLTIHSYNDEGGFYESELIRSHLIDHYIPFLPLERKHVRQCIEFQLRLEGISPYEFGEKLIDEVLDELSFGPGDYDLYAISGCKGVGEKISVMREMMAYGVHTEL